jgi:uncharacterized protein YqeY
MLSERLAADLKQAMLNRDSQTVSVLRMLQAELKTATIAKLNEPLTEPEELGIIQKEIKKRKEAANQYETADNAELSASEAAEAAILQTYLPSAVSDDEVRAFMKSLAEKLGTLEPHHRRDLIQGAMSQFPGRLDGQKAAQLAGELF